MSKTSNLRKLQLAELKLLKRFLDFMEKHNILYFAIGGTVLGAVRHQGFIPWDDDIDIALPRDHYDKLLSLLNDSNEIDFQIFDANNPHPTIVIDKEVEVHRHLYLKADICNAWIDVVFLDGMPSNKLSRKIHEIYVYCRRALFLATDIDNTAQSEDILKHSCFRNLVLWIFKIIHIQGKLDKTKEFMKYENSLRKFNVIQKICLVKESFYSLSL